MICFITRVYGNQIGYLRVLALSLYHNELDNIRLLIVNTDSSTDLTVLAQTVQLINELVLRNDYAKLLDLGIPSMKNDYGYELTDRALAYLYRKHARSTSECDYVIFTNADNFYVQTLARKILPYMKTKLDIIAWGFVSHYNYTPYSKELVTSEKQSVPGIVDDGTEKCIKVALQRGAVDLGAVAYRFQFLWQHNLYFRKKSDTYEVDSDGKFVELAARLTHSTSQCHWFFCTLPNGTICQITQFKHLSQVTFNTHIVLHIFENLYLKLYFILKDLHFFQVISFNIISDQNIRFRFHSTFKKLLSSKVFTLTIFQIEILFSS
ncbi:unnamed protein product [Rotaria socialis]|uniref:Uncharacterized protein n=1 Tax=Rotaria socialis TaxID=392032 RepID=A0A817RS14_9BILA|nr:unnamed protein product [Rotaria socialis]CAF3276058.1 unnamed protein product [Rotaria socialis]CAF3588713.1 unnamed protein product [Rotaria socialis]